MNQYIVDFLCSEKKLVVEIDGGSHLLKQHSDRIRDAMLHADGYRVLRFSGEQVRDSLQFVLERIAEELGIANPHPNPLP